MNGARPHPATARQMSHMPASLLAFAYGMRFFASRAQRTRADRGRVQYLNNQQRGGDEDEEANGAGYGNGHFDVPVAGVHIYLDCTNLASVS